VVFENVEVEGMKERSAIGSCSALGSFLMIR